VLLVVFTRFVPVGNDVRFHPQVLLLSIVLFLFFSEATAGAISCVVDREGLVRKIHFPRLAIPLSVVLTALLNFSVNFVAVFIFALAAGVSPRWTWLEFPVLIAILAVFACGVAMVLSVLYVRFRDMRPIWEVTLQALWYGTPVIYAIEVLPGRQLEEAVMLNPIAVIIEQARHALIDPHAPSALAAAGGWAHLAVPAALVLVALALGIWMFSRAAPRIAEEL